MTCPMRVFFFSMDGTRYILWPGRQKNVTSYSYVFNHGTCIRYPQTLVPGRLSSRNVGAVLKGGEKTVAQIFLPALPRVEKALPVWCEERLGVVVWSVRLGSVPFRSVPFLSVRLGRVRFVSAPFRSFPFGSDRFGSVPFHSIPFRSVRFRAVWCCGKACLCEASRFLDIHIALHFTACVRG